MKLLTTATLFVWLAGTAGAQQSSSAAQPEPAPTDLTKATVMKASDLEAAVARLGNDRGASSVRVLTLTSDNNKRPYIVNVEHRAKLPQNVAVHETEAEMFYVIDGSATAVSGGRIVDGARDGVYAAGKSIDGGISQGLAKGDFLIVPEGLPHSFVDVAPSGLTMIVIHLARTN